MAQRLFFILLVLRDHWNVERESALLARVCEMSPLRTKPPLVETARDFGAKGRGGP